MEYRLRSEQRLERSERIFFWNKFTIVRKKSTQIAQSAVPERTLHVSDARNATVGVRIQQMWTATLAHAM